MFSRLFMWDSVIPCECRYPTDDDEGYCMECGGWINYLNYD